MNFVCITEMLGFILVCAGLGLALPELYLGPPPLFLIE
jgi:hypothetical protein